LLWEIEKDFQNESSIKTINFNKDKKKCSNLNFIRKENHRLICQKISFEPNSAIMKSGGFSEVSTQFNLDKLHQHSHLYTSETALLDFPGRKFRIEKSIEYSKKK